ncbi:MAG: acetyltransferase [Cyanobacteria bacterium RYN_339]|nr:acetyltransferase [Cyanobacteria bacterium RYN_339]
MDPRVEQLDAREIDGIVDLSQSVGWDYAPAEIATAMAAGTMVGVRDSAGGLLACAGIFLYPSLASLGLVIVRPEAQGRGLGRHVTAACVELAGDRPVVLAATEAGRPLYERLGFHTVGTLHKMFAATWTPIDQSVTVADGLPDQVQTIDLDAAALGTSRAAFLAARIAQACDHVSVRDGAGETVGFALAVQAPEVRVIGPVVSQDAGTALALVDALARRHGGRLRIDVPSEHNGLVEALQARGFVLDRIVPVMALRPERLPQGNGTRFAIAAQAFG